MLAAQYRASNTSVHLRGIQHLPPLLLPHRHILLFRSDRFWLPRLQTCLISPYLFRPWSLQFAHHRSHLRLLLRRSPTAAEGALFPRGASSRIPVSLPLHELHLLLAVLQAPQDVLVQLPILPISFRFPEASFLFLELLIVITLLIMLHGPPVKSFLLVQPVLTLAATFHILLVLTSILTPASLAPLVTFVNLPGLIVIIPAPPSSSSFSFSSSSPVPYLFLHPSKLRIMHLVVIATSHHLVLPLYHFTIIQDNFMQVKISLKIAITIPNLLNRRDHLIHYPMLIVLLSLLILLLLFFMLLATKNFISRLSPLRIYYLTLSA